MRVAFFPYDILILATATFLFALFFKKTIFRSHINYKGIDKLVPYALAYMIVSIVFMLIFGEFPVKFFLHDDYYHMETPQTSPQGPVIDEKRLYAFAYNLIIWLICLVVIFRYFFTRKKLYQ